MMAETIFEDLEVVIRDRTPAGSPASCMILETACIDSGVCFAALTMTVQPAAMAGPTFRAAMASGKFDGVTSSTGPTGCFKVRMRAAPSGEEPKRPPKRTASSANQRE